MRQHCAEIVALMGPRSWHVGSTLLQFKRYRNHWKDERWARLTDAALQEFETRGVREEDLQFPDD